MNFIPIIVFILAFLYLTNWFQITTLFYSLVRKRFSHKPITDKWIINTVFKKTELKIPGIVLIEDPRMYGMMAGVPFWPKMILSEGLYKCLNRSELEWVILHEAAHCIFWHNLKTLVYEVSLLGIGIYLVDFYSISMAGSILLAIILSFTCVQLIRWFIEYEADKYSIAKVSDPLGVISAQEKFRENKYKNFFSDERSLGRYFLVWNIYPSKRIEMAEKRLSGS